MGTYIMFGLQAEEQIEETYRGVQIFPL